MSIQCHNISLGAFCACISLSLLVLRFYFLHVTTNSKRIFELEPLLYFFFMVSSPPPPTVLYALKHPSIMICLNQCPLYLNINLPSYDSLQYFYFSGLSSSNVATCSLGAIQV